MPLHYSWHNFALGKPFHAAFWQLDFVAPLHDHDFAEAFLCLEGKGVHEINGQEIPLVPGDLWLVHANDVHCVQPVRDLAFINIAWPLESWQQWLTLTQIESAELRPRCVAPELGALFRRLVRAYAEEMLRPFDVCYLWSELVVRLASPQRVDTRPDWMRRAQRALESEQGLRAGWPLLYATAHVSPAHLSREWKKHFGMTPKEWINARRLEYAARLLLQSAIPIKEISARCGFENKTYFYRIWTQHYGMTPKEYRMGKTLD